MVASTDPLTLPTRADLRVQDRLFFSWPAGSSEVWLACATVLTECLRGACGLELPFDRPDTDTDMDIDIDVDADSDVEMDAKLPLLSQSLAADDLALLLALVLVFTGHRSAAAAASASLDVPVNVDTGLVFVEAWVWVSKLVRLLNEAAELSFLCIAGAREDGQPLASVAFPRLDPSSRPSRMYRSDCDDFRFVFEDSGFTQPPSSSADGEKERERKK